MSENNKYLCPDCNQQNINFNWCQNCNSKQLQKDFDKWTSGNEFIDNFIQDTQLKARNYREVIEWIPYNRFRNIQYLTKGEFSTIYKAIWLDGFIENWDKEEMQWRRNSFMLSLDEEDYNIAKQENVKLPLNQNEVCGDYVVLKSLNNSSNINEDFLIKVL